MVGPIPPTERFGRQNAEKESQRRRIDDALRIDGSQFVRLYEKMVALIADLGTTVETLVSDLTYTKAQVDSRIDTKVATPGAISPSSVTASGTVSAGALSATGNVSAGGNVTASGNVSVGGQFNCVDAYNFDITYTRRTAWLGNDGRLGFASSSRDKKTAIRPASLDVDAVLSLEPKKFEYRAQHAWRAEAAQLPEDDPRHNPDYQVPTEVGLIAEDLVAAGLGEFVIYDADGKAEGIEYSMLVVPLLAVARSQAREITQLRSQVALIADHLNLDLGSETP